MKRSCRAVFIRIGWQWVLGRLRCRMLFDSWVFVPGIGSMRVSNGDIVGVLGEMD